METQSQLPRDFDGQVYLELNSDVARAGMNAEEHYLRYGIHEGRKYRKYNPDIPEENFAWSIIEENRRKHMPLIWQEANYSDKDIELSFRVFDPYKEFSSASTVTVNDRKIPFTYASSGEYIDISFALNPQEYQSTFAKVDFSFYPYQLSHKWRQSWFVPLSKQDIVIPDPNQLLRVIGDSRSSSYLVGGATHATQLAWVLEKDLGLPLDQIKVLDWGCGCGRVSQFLKLRGIKDLVGADIDKDNIQWCQNNIQGITFTAIPYYPPTPFEDNSFDAITGISVMTHLTDDAQRQWLQELKRILRPGGIALLSVRDLLHYHLTSETLDFIYQVNQQGFIDRCRDSALDEITEDLEYYRATYYSKRYIKTVWKEYFQVMDIIEGLVLQDVVVLRNLDN